MNILGHGVDLVETERIKEMLDKHGQRFLDKCFTAGEVSYSQTHRKREAERFAVRFAAKEAVLKAIGTGWRDGIAWTDIEVVREPSGKPMIKLSGRAAEIADEMGVLSWNISLSHSQQFGLASAIALG